MKLYTCPSGTKPTPGHPCGKAGKALDAAGHSYEVEKVEGMKLLPWTRRGDARKKVEELSGQKDVPILVLDDGDVIAGSGKIAKWAKANPA